MSNSFACHNRACFCKAWVGKCSPCKWYRAYTPCLQGATHASYRLVRSVCLFGKSCCYGSLDMQCTASCNPRFAQRSLPWWCGFEELVPAQNKRPYMDSQYHSSATDKQQQTQWQNSFLWISEKDTLIIVVSSLNLLANVFSWVSYHFKEKE